jgi:hypothetical protein
VSLYSQHNLPLDVITSEPWLLEKIKVAASRQISREFAETCTVEMFENVLGDITYYVGAYVLAEKLAEETVTVRDAREVHFHAPATWWQHAKEDWNEWGTRKLKGRRRLWRLLSRVFRLYVRDRVQTRRVEWRKDVVTKQFATFPASPIKTPPHLRGQHVIRYERAEEVPAGW